MYTGCDGNKNNFNTINECLRTCGNKSEKLIIILHNFIVSCPLGLHRVTCAVDPCNTASCSNIPDAVCVVDNCGVCSYKFYNSSGHDITEYCGMYHIKTKVLYIIFYLANCPPSIQPVICPVSPCEYENCQLYPEANCTIDHCGSCKAKFVYNNSDVTAACGMT